MKIRILVFFGLLICIHEINGGKSGKSKGTIGRIAGKVKDKVLGRETSPSSSSSKGSFKDKAIDKIADKIAGQIKKKIPGSGGSSSSRPKGDLGSKSKGTIGTVVGKVKDKVLGRQPTSSGSGSKGSFKDKAIDKITDKIAKQINKKIPGQSGSSGSRPKGDSGQLIGKIIGGNKGYPGSSGTKSKGSKGKIKSTLKKAAVIGVGAYGAYKLGKLTSKYSSWSWGRQHGYSIDDWDDWREVDGLLCRNSLDCEWIDPNLYCQDYELRFTPNVSFVSFQYILDFSRFFNSFQHAWFGGDFASISGECSCPHGMFWDDNEVRCQRPRYVYNLAEKTARPNALLNAFGICFILRQIFNA